jgi:hypothetical protein
MNTAKQDQLERELRSWTDGPKYVMLHSANHLDLIQNIAPPSQILVSSMEITSKWLDKFFTNESGTFFLIVEEQDLKTAMQIKSLHEDLDIRVFSF